MVDLHIHTTCSDGLFSADNILKMAEQVNCKYISITDHNTCEAYQFVRQSNLFSGKIVSGCEFSTFCCGIPIELLGYDFDIDRMQDCIKNLYRFTPMELRDIQKALFFEACTRNKVKFKVKIDRDSAKMWGSDYLFSCIHDFDDNQVFFDSIDDFNNVKRFYRKYISNSGSAFYCDMSKYYPSPEDIISSIHECHGKVFIPHIFEYLSIYDKLLETLVSSFYIDGLECYYSKYTASQQQDAVIYAMKHKLLRSGGSDFHSGNTIKLGVGKGNLRIRPEEIGEWLYNARNWNSN